jgi:hypothetical protein
LHEMGRYQKTASLVEKSRKIGQRLKKSDAAR